MKKLALIVIVTVLAWNCKEEKKSDSHNEMEITETKGDVPILEEGCYGYDKNNNTVLFEIEETTGPVSGNLMYHLEGKDKNTGRFEGTVKEDKLIGTYTFTSEGKESSREVAFLIKEKQLIEGYGELNEEGTAFKSYGSINYSSVMPLAKKECDR